MAQHIIRDSKGRVEKILDDRKMSMTVKGTRLGVQHRVIKQKFETYYSKLSCKMSNTP